MYLYNLVISALYILNKYSHCHQLNNHVDKENIVVVGGWGSGFPEVILEAVSLVPFKIKIIYIKK